MTREPPEQLRTFLVNRYGSKLYNRLYALEADFNCISGFDVWIQVADAIALAETRRQREDKKIRRRKSHGAGSAFPSVGVVVDFLKRKYLAGRDLSDPQLDTRLKQVANRSAKKIKAWILQEQIKKIEEEDPRAKLMLEYVLPWLGDYTKGGTQDLRGSFFLLAVTEHLGMQRGCYSSAARLLETIRETKGKKRKRVTKPWSLARKRIESLKKTHPDYKIHLKTLEDYCLV